MNIEDNKAVVKAFYNAMERHDGQGMINLNAPNSVWIDHGPESSGLRGDWEGSHGIEAFLAAMELTMEVDNVLVKQLFAEGDTVISVVDMKFTPRLTHHQEDSRMVQIFKLQNERITQIETFLSDSEEIYL